MIIFKELSSALMLMLSNGILFSKSHWKALLITLFIIIGGSKLELKAQRLSRDLNVDLLVNQIGYTPSAAKICITKGKTRRNFEVIDIATQQVVYKGELLPQHGDFGDYLTADFSAVVKPGHFYLRSDTLRSYPFNISNSIYQPAINLIVNYFSLQRCGASATGYLSPCHLDDGIRIDNGKHQDVTGGWHDASDLRRWVSATIYGMIGLAKAYELNNGQHKDAILSELMWGNQYFLKMQEPQGYEMDFVGGEIKEHSDNNRWTDNKIGKEGGELKLVSPTAGVSQTQMMLSGSSDDRIIQVQPVEMTGQYDFIAAEALMAKITATNNSGYSQKCLQAAKKCFEWCVKSQSDTTPGIIGAAMQASIELYKTTRLGIYRDAASGLALQLKKLQVNNKDGGPSGFFYTSLPNHEPYKNIWQGCQAFISLCDLVETFPLHKDAPSWKSMIAGYANNYLLLLSKKNCFGIIPYGLYDKQDPGGNRKVGNYWYRYFMEPELEWWVGINSNIASAGIGLMKASTVLKDSKLKVIAQQQLDWILGVNPFNSSTILGEGYNHPKFFGGESFLPSTPVLPGAVLNGLGGDHVDMPVIGDGDWQISEYWTPMVAYTLWLMAEITRDAQ